MNCQNANIGWDKNVRFAIPIDDDLSATAFTSFHESASDDIAIFASWQTREQSHIHFVRLEIECNESTRATTKCDLIFSIIPKIDDRRSLHDISECNHISYGRPAMLAHPAIHTLAAGIEFWWNYATVLVTRRSCSWSRN